MLYESEYVLPSILGLTLTHTLIFIFSPSYFERAPHYIT